MSAYYSFGFTHPLNPIAEKRQAQLERRQAIQALTLDEYVLVYAEQQVAYFDHLQEVAAHCQHKIILRYEDMVEEYASFIQDLQTVVSLKDQVIQELYQRSRPREGVDDGSHRRSGATRRYLQDLQPETIGALNEVLGRTLGEFGYGG